MSNCTYQAYVHVNVDSKYILLKPFQNLKNIWCDKTWTLAVN